MRGFAPAAGRRLAGFVRRQINCSAMWSFDEIAAIEPERAVRLQNAPA